MKTNKKMTSKTDPCDQALSPYPKAKKQPTYRDLRDQVQDSPLCRIFGNDQLIYSDDFIRQAYAFNKAKRIILREG